MAWRWRSARIFRWRLRTDTAGVQPVIAPAGRWNPAVLAAGDVRGLSEFRAVLVEELSYRARGMAGDLGEGAGGVVVLAGQYRPLARDKQLSRPGRYPGAGQAIEVLPVGSDAEGDGLAEFGREQPEHVGPGQRDRPGQVVVRAPQRGVGEHAQPDPGHVAVVDQGHPAGVGQAGPGA